MIFILILGGSSSLYLATINPSRFGFYHDDGIYMVTAKALATGQGYRIISLPYEPSQTKFPPLYPSLLSLIWRVNPQFPDNLLPMMLLSVLATAAFLALTWCYLNQKSYLSRWQALLVVALTAVNARTVILATGIYSEMVYSSLSIAGLWLAEMNEKKENSSWASSVVLGTVMGLAFLTRISGISLLIAVISYYLLRKKFIKASLLLAVSGLFVLAWIIWCYITLNNLEAINVAFYTSYLRDFDNNISNLQSLLNIVAINVGLILFTSVPLISLGLGYLQAQNLFEWGPIVISHTFVFSLTFVFIAAGFLRHASLGLRPLHVYMTFYLGLHLFWPYTTHDRFLTPILPFLLLFLIRELNFLVTLVRDNLKSGSQVGQTLSAAFFTLLLLALSSITIKNYSSSIRWLLTSKEIYAGRASEDAQAIRWIKAHTSPSDVLICYRDPLYYLYTGRKATRSLLVQPRVPKEEAAIHERAKTVFRIINESNGRYLILTSSDFEYDEHAEIMRKNLKNLLEQYPKTFASVFKSSDGRTAIYRIMKGTSNLI